MANIGRILFRQQPTESSWVILVDKNDNVLMLNRSDGKGWNFPGGGVDEGEDPLTSARRELDEEAGVKLSKSKFRFITSLLLLKGKKKEAKTCHFYMVRVKDSIKSKIKTNKESTGWDWIALKDVSSEKLHAPTERFITMYGAKKK